MRREPAVRAITAVIAVVFGLLASPAAAFVKCRTADGQLHFVDAPPADCVVEAEYRSEPIATPAPPGETAADAAAEDGGSPDQLRENAADAQAITARRRIERALDDSAEELDRVRAEITTTPIVAAGAYQASASGIIAQARDQRVLDEMNANLRMREALLLSQIAERKDELAKLTDEVEKSHGGELPSWWSRSARCRRCP